jgi:S-adenosylmethionine synthetase
LYKAFPDKHAEDVLIVYIRNGKNIMIKIKITVNGRHFHDINAAFQEIERALEENVSRKKQEIIMKEKARRMKSSKKA